MKGYGYLACITVIWTVREVTELQFRRESSSVKCLMGSRDGTRRRWGVRHALAADKMRAIPHGG